MAKKPSPPSSRHFLRRKVPAGMQIACAVHRYDAFDITVYGLAFLISHSDIKHFSEGMHLPDVSFEIDGRKITVGARVIYVTSAIKTGLMKVAVEFNEIGNDDVWFLSRFVAEVARKPKKRAS